VKDWQASTPKSYSEVQEMILGALSPPGRSYWGAVILCLFGLLYGASCWAYQILTGMGVAGINHPVNWGIYLVNFVFWVGIAHSGTLISAILYLLRARWRTSIARAAEAMTVFAVMIAGLFPFIHLGRVWIFYWIIPYPNQRDLWPNFQSPLVFDFLAISTYLTVSSMFWYMGMLPDLAALRDQSTGLKRRIYGIFSLGWQGTHIQWRHYGTAYLLFAAFATPLVISVHSVVSWDFALSIVPGWHSTIFAPYFVAGAIHSGLAMVLTLLIPMRGLLGLQPLINVGTLESIAKTMVLTGLIVGYSYGVEYFMAWYSGNMFEWDTFIWRAFGHYAPQFWVMVVCNVAGPLLFLIKAIRTNLIWLFAVGIIVNIGMWYERFVIIVGSMSHEYVPHAWGVYSPSWVELSIMLGSFSMFLFLFLLFCKFVPPVSVFEMKEHLWTHGKA